MVRSSEVCVLLTVPIFLTLPLADPVYVVAHPVSLLLTYGDFNQKDSPKHPPGPNVHRR